MRFLATIALLIIVTHNACSQHLGLDELRTLYPKAAEEPGVCEKLHSGLNKSELTNTLLGYSGAISMMMARHAKKPANKLNYFTKGKAKLEKAIANAPNDPELRLLRLSYQLHCPKKLNYQAHLSEDSTFLQNNLHRIKDPRLKHAAKKFIE